MVGLDMREWKVEKARRFIPLVRYARESTNLEIYGIIQNKLKAALENASALISFTNWYTVLQITFLFFPMCF